MHLSLYYLMYGQKPRLPIDNRFRLASPQAEKHSNNKFLGKLNAPLKWCYELADLHQCKEYIHHKHQYDWKMIASKLEPGDLCLVRRKVFGGKHKIGDCWEILNIRLLITNQFSQYTLLNRGRRKDELG